MRTHRPGETSIFSPSTAHAARRLLLGLACCLLTALGAAQEPPADQELQLDADEIRERISAAEADSSLEDPVRQAAVADFKRALDALSRAAEFETSSRNYDQKREASQAKLEATQSELASPAASTEPEVDPQWSLSDIEARLHDAEKEADDAEEYLKILEGEIARRNRRVGERGDEERQLRKRLTETRKELSVGTPPGHPLEAEAWQLRLHAEAQEAQAGINALDAEQRRDEVQAPMLPIYVDLAQRKAETSKALHESWDRIIRERRGAEASKAAEEATAARDRLAKRHEALRELVERISELSDQLTDPTGVVSEQNVASEYQAKVDVDYKRLWRSYSDAIERLKIGRESAAFGLFLRLEYDKLPSPRALRSHARWRRQELSNAAYGSLTMRERRAQLGDISVRVEEVLSRVRQVSPEDLPELRAAAAGLLTTERQLVDRLRRNYDDYGRQMERLDRSYAALERLTDDYRDFIQSQILGIRSVDNPFRFRPQALADGLGWVLRGDPELDEPTALLRDLGQRWYLPAVLLALLGGLWLARRRAIARLDSWAPLVRRYRSDSLTLTWKGLFATVIAALPLPVALLGAAWLLRDVGQASVWRLSWAEALTLLASYMLPLAVLTQTLRPQGLARAHFRWPEQLCNALSSAVRKYLVPALLLAILQLVVQGSGEPTYRYSAGRWLFVLAMVFVTLFAWRTLRPGGPVLASYYERHPDALMSKARRLAFALGVAGGASLGLAATVGYLYTARVVSRSLLATMILILMLLVLQGLANRWLFFHRRRMAVEQAQQQRQERAQQEGAEASTEPEIEVDVGFDIPTLDSHTRALFRGAALLVLLFGLASIWSGILPALSALDRVQLWPELQVTEASSLDIRSLDAKYSVTPLTDTAQPAVDSQRQNTDEQRQQPSADKESAPTPIKPTGMTMSSEVPNADESGQKSYVLTLADLLRALLIAVASFVVTRNIPALLEIGILSRINLDTGARYAITTIVRYILMGIGITLVFGSLGIGWSSIQWLAAALTFGLAFGLQEIFANFISGLILLLERPIRIGDLVTVGTLTGRVAKIHTRATTILDFDNKELLIPNKTLITGEVTNWTLSDSITRLNIPVGVAYGSDTRKVCETLLKAGQDNPFALKDPAPSVLFTGFGNSSLDFTLRIHIANRDLYVDAMNDAHLRIDDLFREEGIEIPFPQRDLHLRTSDGTLRIGRAEQSQNDE